MNVLKVYKNLAITYIELEHAMNRLKFQTKVERSKDAFKEEILGRPIFFIVFYNNKYDDFFALMQRQPEDLVPKDEIVMLSDELYQFGYIKHFDDLAKMIERERLAKQKKAPSTGNLQTQRLTE